jgi:5-methylcytosine-specific restriction endonuclease McrA
MTWDRSKYPDNWEEIATQVKEAAGWCCRHCGHPNSTVVPGRILTVHHWDLDPSNCDLDNLVALCQKCHLHLQAVYRPGQLWLPGLAPKWAEERGKS